MRAVNCGAKVMFVVLLAGAGACAEDPPPAPLSEQLQRLDADLQIGARGEGVRAVHAYLTSFGYFPNDRLAVEYPSWRPLVAEPPADLSVFDEQTRQAVGAFQRTAQIPVTGVVDEATRAALRAPRCGVPEGIEALDEDNKYALFGEKWSKTRLSWWLENVADTGFTREQIYDVLRPAFAVWAAQTSLSFTESFSTTPDIVIKFAFINEANGQRSGKGGLVGQATRPEAGDITLDRAETWSLRDIPPAGQQSIKAVVAHEVGHALGLNHSSRAAVMLPSVGPPTLLLDDKIAISAKYDTYGTLPGRARDIGANGTGHMWILGLTPIGNDFGIWKWNGTTWIADAEGAGTRITVDAMGRPWVVGSDGSIWRKLTTDPAAVGQWQRLPDCATDIGASHGSSGAVWIVDCRPANGDPGRVMKWDETTWQWQGGDQSAKRITVDSSGRPWIARENRMIRRRSSSSPTTGSWETLPGTVNDLAIGPGDYAWSIGPVSSGQENLAPWNEQNALGIGSPPPPAVKSWAQGKRMGVGGPNAAVAVGLNGRPFMVDNDGFIWTSIDGAP